MYATRVNVDRWEENCEEKILKLREKRKEEKKMKKWEIYAIQCYSEKM